MTLPTSRKCEMKYISHMRDLWTNLRRGLGDLGWIGLNSGYSLGLITGEKVRLWKSSPVWEVYISSVHRKRRSLCLNLIINLSRYGAKGEIEWSMKRSQQSSFSNEVIGFMTFHRWSLIGNWNVPSQTWKQPRCPSAAEWIRKLQYIYTMEYYSAIKNNTSESVLMGWMKLKPIIESEVSQKEKHQYSILMNRYMEFRKIAIMTLYARW